MSKVDPQPWRVEMQSRIGLRQQRPRERREGRQMGGTPH